MLPRVVIAGTAAGAPAAAVSSRGCWRAWQLLLPRQLPQAGSRPAAHPPQRQRQRRPALPTCGSVTRPRATAAAAAAHRCAAAAAAGLLLPAPSLTPACERGPCVAGCATGQAPGWRAAALRAARRLRLREGLGWGWRWRGAWPAAPAQPLTPAAAAAARHRRRRRCRRRLRLRQRQAGWLHATGLVLLLLLVVVVAVLP
jgi:hypothetical protein